MIEFDFPIFIFNYRELRLTVTSPHILPLRENPHCHPTTSVYPTQNRRIHATRSTQKKNAACQTTRAGKLRLEVFLRGKQIVHVGFLVGKCKQDIYISKSSKRLSKTLFSPNFFGLCAGRFRLFCCFLAAACVFSHAARVFHHFPFVWILKPAWVEPFREAQHMP